MMAASPCRIPACAPTASASATPPGWPRRFGPAHLDKAAFDAEYVRKLIEGDAGVESHFAGYFGALLRIKLRGRLRSDQEVEDLGQETLLRVLVALRRDRRLEQPERLGAFVHAVCNNVLFEFYRRAGRSIPLPEEMPEPPAPGLSADERLIDEERRTAVRRVVASLPRKDRELLRLLFFEERDKDEICRSMNVTRGYLRVLLFRARAKFRETLGPAQRTAVVSGRMFGR
jgi:RNA polymerase sigma-70 factor, ECF subfamily